jgi:signal recognition particle receptor subunit beta
VQLDFRSREVTLKLVYYGPSQSGKSANLRALQDRIGAARRPRLITLDANDDRTLFLDLLPLAVELGDHTLRINVYTVPGKPELAATRRLVLRGVDGVAFIADSRNSETRSNAESFVDLKQNLRDIGRSLSELPLVIQFNKRDAHDVRTDDELSSLARRGGEPVFRSVATRGEGVTETFLALLELVLSRLAKSGELTPSLRMTPAAIVDAVCASLVLPAPVAAARIGALS